MCYLCSRIRATTMDKNITKISQDTLYKYIREHDVKISRIADAIGMDQGSVSACFLHLNNRHGHPKSFTVENIAKLNEGLRTFAIKLRGCMLQFGTEKMYTNKHNRTYDPGMIEPINKLGEYLNMAAVMERLLGWNKNKKLNVFSNKASKIYGNISQKDVDALNMEIISIASFFDSVEVVPDDNAFDGYSPSSSSSR